MKRFLGVAFTLCLALGFVACGEDNTNSNDNSSAPSSSSTCDAKTYKDNCQNNIAYYCENGNIQQIDCGQSEGYYCDVYDGFADCVMECQSADEEGIYDFCEDDNPELILVECLQGESGKLSGFETYLTSYCEGNEFIYCNGDKMESKTCTSCEMNASFDEGVCK